MFNNTQIELVRKINESPLKAYFAITGGGQTFIGNYLSISGGSKTVLGAIVPYNQAIFDDFAGKVDKYASCDAAFALAKAAYREARKASDSRFAVGVGVACSLTTDGERVGRTHRYNICVYCNDFEMQNCGAFILENGHLNTRFEQENFVCNTILDVLDDARALHEEIYTNGEIERVLINDTEGLTPMFFQFNNEAIIDDINTNKFNQPICIYPGSFSILHEGHKAVAKLAEKILNCKVYPEITFNNADKGSISLFEMRDRVANLTTEGVGHAITTPAKTFKEKVEWLRENGVPNDLYFVLGADVWTRIWDEKYGHKLDELAAFFEKERVKFLVFSRNDIDKNIKIGENLRVQSKEADDFNMPISSSQIKAANKN